MRRSALAQAFVQLLRGSCAATVEKDEEGPGAGLLLLPQVAAAVSGLLEGRGGAAQQGRCSLAAAAAGEEEEAEELDGVACAALFAACTDHCLPPVQLSSARRPRRQLETQLVLSALARLRAAPISRTGFALRARAPGPTPPQSPEHAPPPRPAPTAAAARRLPPATRVRERERRGAVAPEEAGGAEVGVRAEPACARAEPRSPGRRRLPPRRPWPRTRRAALGSGNGVGLGLETRV